MNIGREEKVYIIGSLKLKDEIIFLASTLIAEGYVVRYVQEETDKNITFESLVIQCFNNIQWADVIYIVKKEDGSIGEGVTYESVFAKFLRKPIKYIDGGALKFNMPKFEVYSEGDNNWNKLKIFLNNYKKSKQKEDPSKLRTLLCSVKY